MGLFEKVFGSKKAEPKGVPQGYFKTFNGYVPTFYNWNGSLYESELVRAAIHAKATHISKLSVDAIGSAKPKLRALLKSGPNEFQTYSQWLYRIATILEVNNTCYIVPVLDEYGDITGYYPIIPDATEIVQYSGEPWLRFKLRSGQNAAIELSRVGIMTKFQYADDFRGESNGRALKPTMDLIAMQNQGIQEGIKNSASYRFMARITNFTNQSDLAKERKMFSKFNLQADSEAGGLLLFPSKYDDIQQIKATPYTVDTAQMQLIEDNVFSYFGVNKEILQGSAVGDKLDAFFNSAIEPFAIQLSDVLTRMTFTSRERASGSAIRVNANRLQYMTVSEKSTMTRILGDRGAILIDEIRELFNYAPLPDGAGQVAPVRGEYYSVDEMKEGAKDDKA